METMYKVIDREAGNKIESNLTLQEAKNLVALFENEDKMENIYIPNFYEIVGMEIMEKQLAIKSLVNELIIEKQITNDMFSIDVYDILMDNMDAEIYDVSDIVYAVDYCREVFNAEQN